jgi:hypothetical protein
MADPNVDELIRAITEPEERATSAKSAARERLMVATTSDRGVGRRLLRPGRLALVAALLLVPAGVAVATELGGNGDQFVAVEDCPELLAVVEARALDTEGLVLADCPVGAEVQETVALLAALERRRTELELNGARSEAILGIGRSESGELWHLEGISGDSGSSGP